MVKIEPVLIGRCETHVCLMLFSFHPPLCATHVRLMCVYFHPYLLLPWLLSGPQNEGEQVTDLVQWLNIVIYH